MALAGGIVGLIIGGIAGLVIGSFIAALTWRWPQGRSIVFGRSACDACGAALGPLELVPLLSLLWLRGRCRHCGVVIAPRHIAIEIAAGAIGVTALALHSDGHGIAGAVFGWMLLALLVLDVEHLWLPDRLTLPLGLAGVAATLWLGRPLLHSLAGAAIGWVSLAGIAAAYKAMTGRSGMGGGDPKLFAAIGAWLGWLALPVVLVLAAVLGLALAGYDRLSGRAVTRYSRVPLGAMLAAAAWPVWLADVLSPALSATIRWP
jgi:leader peptidase (prepilin peptidase)/N-methyltransferase